MTFNDIFKSSFLENVSSVTILDMAIALVLAFGVGMFIFMVYKMILSISLDTFSTQNPKLLWNQLSEMEQISMERSGMDICSISGVARSGG